MEIIGISKLGAKDANKVYGEERLNLFRTVRKDLLKAFDIYKSNLSFGIEIQSELEITEVKNWYKKLLDLESEAFFTVPCQVKKYL